MGKQWRCAVVGTGTVGEWHVRTIPTLPNAKLVAVCDLIEARARAALEKNGLSGIPVYTDEAEMLRKEKDLDVVHVCTPSGDHLGPATLAMEAGKFVICEKPLEIQLDRIDRMAETAAKRGVRIAGVFQNRWHPANRALRDAAVAGRFGRIAWAGCFTPWYRPDKYYEEVAWRGTWKLDGGGAVMNQSVHAIDLLQWIAGPVRTVCAFASSRIHPSIETEDTLSATLAFENGAFGTIMGTTAMFPGQPARVEIGGENGTAISEQGLKVFRFRDQRPEDDALAEKLAPPPPELWRKRVEAAGGPELLAKLGMPASVSTGGGASNKDVKLDLHSQNMRSIFAAWDEGRDAETAPAEARKAVAIVLAMYESVRKGGAPVDVK